MTTAGLPSASVVNVPYTELETAISMVRAIAEIVPLRVMVERHQAGRSTRRLVALTFDDAYAALLVTLGDVVRTTPITIFVTTHAANGGRRFWWDRIDDLFPRVAPARWRRFEDAIGVTEAFRAGQPAELGPLRPLRQWIMATHRGRWPDALDEPLTALESEVGFATAHRAMTWAEVGAFAAHELVDVGVHTLTHPVLPLLNDAEMVSEIRNAYDMIRGRVGRAVPILAFPFGLYDERTARLAREAGMIASLSLGNRPLRGAYPNQVLPRLSMGVGLKRWKFALRMLLPRSAAIGYPALPSATT